MRIGKQVKRLYDLEIDEVSLVDRPANQFGTVAFSKRAEDDMPELYDVDGNLVGEDELEHGETVFDADGNELLYVEEGTPEYDEITDELDDDYEGDDYDAEGAYDDDRELAGVGKSARSAARDLYRVPAAFARGRGASGGVRSRRELRAASAGRRARRGASSAAETARNLPGAAREYGRSNVGPRVGAARERGRNARAYAGTPAFRSQRNLVAGGAGGGAVVAGGGVAYGDRRGRRVNKSLGREVYEELSKALSQSDRDEAIAKALDVVDDLAAQNEELYEVVGKMADERAMQDFAALADTYGPLPVHPQRLGAIMKRASETLPAEDLDVLDRLLSSVGEQLYTEVGKAGTGASVEIVDQIEALAGELVSKSDMTPEQAFAAIMDANPEAYDEYLAETGQRY